MLIMHVVVDINASCVRYGHILILTMSAFVKERFSRILRYVYSNVHECST